jgi:hypothetical protein
VDVLGGDLADLAFFFGQQHAHFLIGCCETTVTVCFRATVNNVLVVSFVDGGGLAWSVSVFFVGFFR